MLSLPLAIDYSFSISEILVAVLSLLVTGTLVIIRQQREKIKEIQKQLSDKKFELYNELLSLFFDILKDKDSADPKEIGQKIINVKKELLLYAPDSVLYKFIEWSNYTNNHETGDNRHMLIFIEVMKLVRQDMGHPKTSFKEDDFWRLIMKSDQDIQLMKASLRKP